MVSVDQQFFTLAALSRICRNVLSPVKVETCVYVLLTSQADVLDGLGLTAQVRTSFTGWFRPNCDCQ